ncbi:hypothetical protein FACS1894153_0240 [Bacteroidia bacterium]|nr:hypothetical protein FACS1894153_0240 [Bacteroidia bacterium]
MLFYNIYRKKVDFSRNFFSKTRKKVTIKIDCIENQHIITLKKASIFEVALRN